ncbi:MAG TPA: ABC transporter ATP-binding protein [Candidatus Limnocylindrales bacterium]
MARLELRGITKRFGDQVAVAGFDLAVENGELVTFLGPSGCGKTTTLRITAGFEQPDTGEVLVDGQDVTALPPNRRGMGMVFQGYALFPNMTARDNVDFGLAVRQRPVAERRRRVDELLALFHLDHVATHYPHQMSGGQQQRVALARAIAIEPAVLLLDEPLSAVDAKVREELRTEIRRMQVQLGITTILVTHDQAEALSISDRVVVMDRGVIEEVGTPARIYAEPRSAFTAGFIGAMNELPVRVVSQREGLVEREGRRFAAPGATELPDGAAGLLLVRPESLQPLDDGAVARPGTPILRGRVEVQTFLGATTRLLLGDLARTDQDLAGTGAAADRGGSPEQLAVDVPSSAAARWPVGSELQVAVPLASTRVIAARSAADAAAPRPSTAAAPAGVPAAGGR